MKDTQHTPGADLLAALIELTHSDFSRCQELQAKADAGDPIAKAIVGNAWKANEYARAAIARATGNP